jgi:hypothetical protein
MTSSAGASSTTTCRRRRSEPDTTVRRKYPGPHQVDQYASEHEPDESDDHQDHADGVHVEAGDARLDRPGQGRADGDQDQAHFRFP